MSAAEEVIASLNGAVPHEVTFYRTVVEAGHLLGWRVHHQRSTSAGTPITGDAGFPDFVLVHPRGHVLFVELKSDRKAAKLTMEQEAWRDALVAAGARWLLVWVPRPVNHTGLGMDDLLSMMSDLALTP